MIKFIPAEKLKDTFGVFGHFYSIDLKSGERIDCRSILEIVTKRSKPSETSRLLDQIPDAIFIMMNPGSSKPLAEVNNIISEGQISQLQISLVPTKPDTTQYQVMRVMHYRGWEHVRVLNISDLRDPKSGKFVERYIDIENRTGFAAHSLFSDERADEMARKLIKRSETPIVCAWGVSPDLDPLIERCLDKVSGMSNLTGLLKLDTDNKYFHPLLLPQPKQVKWVIDMVAHLTAPSFSKI